MDFRRCTHIPPTPVNIQGMVIEMVKSYMHLSVHLNNKLDWTNNTNTLYRKGQSRLSAEETQVFWSAEGTPGDLLSLCGGISHLLWNGLLGQQHLDC